MRRATVALAALALLAAAPPAGGAAVPNTWSRALPLLDAASDASWAALPGGRIFVFGGTNIVSRYQSVLPRPMAEIYDPKSGIWAGATDAGINIPRSIRGVGLADGRVLVMGANPKPGHPLEFETAAKVYEPRNEPRNDTWTPVAGPAASEWFALLTDGRVLGLMSGSGTDSQFSVWDPRTDTSTPVTDAGGARAPLTRLRDGRVLATGGVPAIFDPARGTWARTSPPGKLEGPAVRLADGRVLVTGNSGGPGFLFDGATGRWRAAGRFPDAVPGTATLLRDGRVFATEGTPLLQGRRTWIYDPAKRGWFAATSSRGGHSSGVVARLPDGRVLVAGGTRCIDDCFDPASTFAAEIYNPPPRRPVIQRADFSGGARPRFVNVRLNERVSMALRLDTPGATRGIFAVGRSLRWRLGGRIRPGRWTLTVTATDQFGRRARTLRVSRTVR
jgi:hypothetical protein